MSDYSQLAKQLGADIECFVFDSIPSTNDYLSGLNTAHDKTQVCVTAEQTLGKGQHNRHWISGKNSSVILSIRRVFDSQVVLNGLSLAVGLAVVEVLKQYGVNNPQLKWPNDVLVNNQKLAGILIENSLQGRRQSTIIGLGLNVHLTDDIDCKTPWIDLKQILKKELDLAQLTLDLIRQILIYCQLFEKLGFENFAQQWHSVDYLAGKTVFYQHEKHPFKGVCCGVDNNGLLQVETTSGIQSIYSSERLRFLSVPCYQS